MTARPRHRITVLGTTDLHGHVRNWDYLADQEYADPLGNEVGLAKIATLVSRLRTERGAENCVLLDAGDTIQGSALAEHFARVDPVTAGAKHPMAVVMNHLGYDAAALGNHDFTHGLATLRAFEDQLDFPLLGANVHAWGTGAPAFTPWVVRTVHAPAGPPVRVGILGLVTPGVAVWDERHVAGRLRFEGVVEQAARSVPELRAAGADVVLVCCHSGADGASSYGAALPWPENASTLLAQRVPGIDAILVGHAHVEIAERFVAHEQTGRPVLLSEPVSWGMRLTVIDLDLELTGGHWRVAGVRAQLRHASEVPEDPRVVDLVAPHHDAVRRHLSTPVATSRARLSLATARFEDSSLLRLLAHVQASALQRELAGSAAADLPVLSLVAPTTRSGMLPLGTITRRHLAGLYRHDSTLVGARLSGAELRAHLERAAAFFHQVTGPGPVTADELTNAPTPLAPHGTPDDVFDTAHGLDHPLTYAIDLARPVGSRVTDLRYAGTSVHASDQFAVAVGSYRHSGGGGFAEVAAALVLHDGGLEIRQLLQQWVRAERVVDGTRFRGPHWRLMANGRPLRLTGGENLPS
ncbi:MAG TPA: 5'-nucleotidase C-terminal domain-containing protein [Segeticoccus sp.]|uniref:bifunctional metallophosphatase/5'-nucleotidase n=1 Tax=Segeticoccus sp. TaxID=2706531 RepID=UPI002D80F7EE|nr:5'-nucleotidase C-terminal domain-containing protein [Segeticoccus sp.]HET8601473.1 5'-nucleotidase C-terminal domain-containing protein [Segeticoccus sp.]